MFANETYVEGRLAVDVLAINIDFVIVNKRDNIVHVAVLDSVKQDVNTHLLYLSNHCHC